MMFVMDGKQFFTQYLETEDAATILDSYYVVVSTRIRRREEVDNVVCISSGVCYPNSLVFQAGGYEEMEIVYYSQLEAEAVPFLAGLIKQSIQGDNIIFLCTKKERKYFKYLDWLADFIWFHFEYPVYDYEKFINGCSLIEYDETKVLKYCKKVVKDAKNLYFKTSVSTRIGRQRILHEMKKYSKKKLRKLLAKEGVDGRDMSKSEMVDILEIYL